VSLGSVVLAATADVGVLLGVLTTAANSIDYSMSVPAATAASGAVAIANVAGLGQLAQISAVTEQLATLIGDPTSIAATLISLVQDFAGTSVDYRWLADQFTGAAWTWPVIASDIHAPAIAANRAALQALMVNQSLIEAVRASASMTWATQQAAYTFCDDLAGRLDGAIAASSSRSMRMSLRALRNALVTDIYTRAANLAALQSWTNPGEVPALVLANRIYDDPTMAADIAARNAVSPLFVPPGMLTILSPKAAAS